MNYKNFIILITFFLIFAISCACIAKPAFSSCPVKPIIYIQDGGSDDLVACVLLMLLKDVKSLPFKVAVKAIITFDGDCHARITAENLAKIFKLLGFSRTETKLGIFYTAPSSPPAHEFPEAWRAESNKIAKTGLIRNVQLTSKEKNFIPGKTLLYNLLNATSENSMTIFLTCPAYPLVIFLKQYPNLCSKIREIVWMGGVVDKKHHYGNVEGKSGAEWNFYYDPVSTRWLIKHFMNKITIYPLDITDYFYLFWDIKQNIPYPPGQAFLNNLDYSIAFLDYLNCINKLYCISLKHKTMTAEQWNPIYLKLVRVLYRIPVNDNEKYSELWDPLVLTHLLTGRDELFNNYFKSLTLPISINNNGVINNGAVPIQAVMDLKHNTRKYIDTFYNFLIGTFGRGQYFGSS